MLNQVNQVNLGSYLLDQFTLKDIRLSIQRYDAIATYFCEHYSYFTNQRSLIIDDLKKSLLESCKPFNFHAWQRIVDCQFSLKPLSAKGSILNMPGGRFNIGSIDEIKYPTFSALYLAENREIAYKEKHDLYKTNPTDGLTSEELALTSDSISIFNVEGKINNVLMIEESSLKKFFSLVKNIKLPRHLIQDAKRLHIPVVLQVKSTKGLVKSILYPHWKEWPMILGIPSSSQILGQICFAAGIEAISYPSKMNSNKKCLAIFPNNLANSASYVEIPDAPHLEPVYKRLDSTTFYKM